VDIRRECSLVGREAFDTLLGANIGPLSTEALMASILERRSWSCLHWHHLECKEMLVKIYILRKQKLLLLFDSMGAGREAAVQERQNT
jgi:hypothetical protein